MKAMKGHRKHLSIYVDPEVSEALRSLSAKTRIPQQSHLREAVSDLLAKYEQKVPKRASTAGVRGRAVRGANSAKHGE